MLMPKAKSKQKKELQGTSRKDRDGEQPEYSALESMPEPPKKLNEHGRTFWYEVGGVLCAKGVMAKAYLPAFSECAMHYGLIETAAEKVAEDGPLIPGDRGVVKHPGLQVIRDNSIQFRQYCAMFGLDPSNVGKVAVSKPAEKPEGLMALVG